MNTQLSKIDAANLSDEALRAQLGESARWSANYNVMYEEIQRRNFDRDRRNNIARHIEFGDYTVEEAIQMGKLTNEEAIAWGMVADNATALVKFDNAEFEIESIEDATHHIFINPLLTEEAILQTARDLVYATIGRATMYLDSIQDIVDWIASSGIMARCHLGQWHKSEFGYTLCAMVDMGNDTAIDLWVYALSNEDGRASAHTILVGNEFAEFEEALIAAKEEARQMEAITAAIRFASYTRSRLMRGYAIDAHLGALRGMVGDLCGDTEALPQLGAAYCAMLDAHRDYTYALYYPHLRIHADHGALVGITEAMAQLSQLRIAMRA